MIPASQSTNHESTFDKVKRLVELRLELASTRAKLIASESLSTAAVYGMAIVTGLLFVLFASFALAWALGDWWENPGLGFLVVAGIYLLAAVVLISAKDSMKRSVQTKLDQALDRLAGAGLADMDMDEVTRAALPGRDSRLEGIESPAPVSEPGKADPQNAPRLSQEAKEQGKRLEDLQNTPRNTGRRAA